MSFNTFCQYSYLLATHAEQCVVFLIIHKFSLLFLQKNPQNCLCVIRHNFVANELQSFITHQTCPAGGQPLGVWSMLVQTSPFAGWTVASSATAIVSIKKEVFGLKE